MTTNVTVSVGGRYRATVVQDDREPVVIDGSYGGDSARKTFSLPHPAQSTFVITEEQVPEEPANHPDTVVSATEAPAADAETKPAPDADQTA